MIAQTDERRIGVESQAVGPFGDFLICLAILAVMVVVPAILAALIVTVGEFALQHVELPTYFVFRN